MSIAIGTDFTELVSRLSSSKPFASEASLINVVLDKINQFIEGDNILSSTEIPIGAGIVDVVAAKSVIPQGSISQHESLSGMEAYILSRLHFKQHLTLQKVIQRVDLPAKIVINTLDLLVNKQYIRPSGNCYLRSEAYIHNLTAIEGKIKNWKRALVQANRNRLFTSQSFVALDAKYSRPALRNIQLFVEARVGLAIVFADGDISIAYRPPKAKPIAPIMPILAESALLGSIGRVSSYSFTSTTKLVS